MIKGKEIIIKKFPDQAEKIQSFNQNTKQTLTSRYSKICNT